MENRQFVFVYRALYGVFFLALLSCGGGGGSVGGAGGGSSSGSVAVPISAGVTADLITTNLNPWNNIASGKLKRWPYENSLIPVKLNGSTHATYALDLIEATLGMTIFDRSSIASTPDDNVQRGLIVSMGTAVGPSGPGEPPPPSCGNVSPALNSSTAPPNSLDANGNINAKLYVNIGSVACAPRNSIAVHEFGHAIGLGAHFNGFGIDGAIEGNFWNILKTLYKNPVGATVNSISVYVDVIEGMGTSDTTYPATI